MRQREKCMKGRKKESDKLTVEEKYRHRRTETEGKRDGEKMMNYTDINEIYL